MVTAGGLVFRGASDGNFLALDARTGEELWRFQTGFGADAPPMTYEVDGEQYVAIATGGNQSAAVPSVMQCGRSPERARCSRCGLPPPPPTVAGPTGPSPKGWTR